MHHAFFLQLISKPALHSHKKRDNNTFALWWVNPVDFHWRNNNKKNIYIYYWPTNSFGRACVFFVFERCMSPCHDSRPRLCFAEDPMTWCSARAAVLGPEIVPAQRRAYPPLIPLDIAFAFYLNALATFELMQLNIYNCQGMFYMDLEDGLTNIVIQKKYCQCFKLCASFSLVLNWLGYSNVLVGYNVMIM